MHDEPFAVLVLEDHGPAEIPHLDFASFRRHLLSDGGGGPNEIAVRMDRDVIIDSKLRALISGEYASSRPSRIRQSCRISAERCRRRYAGQWHRIFRRWRDRGWTIRPRFSERWALSGAGPVVDFFIADILVWAAAERVRASRQRKTGTRRFSMFCSFGNSGGIFASGGKKSQIGRLGGGASGQERRR